jgi:hypothetical protein
MFMLGPFSFWWATSIRRFEPYPRLFLIFECAEGPSPEHQQTEMNSLNHDCIDTVNHIYDHIFEVPTAVEIGKAVFNGQSRFGLFGHIAKPHTAIISLNYCRNDSPGAPFDPACFPVE